MKTHFYASEDIASLFAFHIASKHRFLKLGNIYQLQKLKLRNYIHSVSSKLSKLISNILTQETPVSENPALGGDGSCTGTVSPALWSTFAFFPSNSHISVLLCIINSIFRYLS